MEPLNIGDTVVYQDINLRCRGKVTEIEGEWIWVLWTDSDSPSKEWIRNLRKA